MPLFRGLCVLDIPGKHEFMDLGLVELLKTGEVDFLSLEGE
jgi:predicted protein tyrosine phosphatase